MPEPRSRGWEFMSGDGVSMRSEVERLLVVDDEGPILHALQRTFEAAELNKGLEKLVQERTTNLLDGMVAVLDYRDTETQWHSRRVSRFTRRIAEELGVSDERDLRTIEMGSLLHDIGKIGVRDAVLLKPGPLDQEEWVEMREHPRLGWAPLPRIPLLRETSDDL